MSTYFAYLILAFTLVIITTPGPEELSGTTRVVITGLATYVFAAAATYLHKDARK